MGGFDRTKYKPSSLKVIKDQEKEVALKRPSKRSNKRHGYDEGENVFRIYPYHPDGGGASFAEPFCVSYLELEVPKYVEGKLVEGQTELKRKEVFNAKVHGGLEKDPVEEYMQFAKDVAIPNLTGQDTEKAIELWKQITGFKGIKPADGWMAYADKEVDGQWVFDILPIKKSIKDGLNVIITKVTKGTIASMDPFTDPETGIAIVVTKDSAAGEQDPNKYYAVELQSITKQTPEGLLTTSAPTPLTDAQLQAFEQEDPLYKRYVNAYTRKDFDKQLEGLHRFDQAIGLGVFELDEFLNILEEISKLVPEAPTTEEQTEAPQTPDNTVDNTPPETGAPAPTDELPKEFDEPGNSEPQSNGATGTGTTTTATKTAPVKTVVKQEETAGTTTDINDSLAAIREKLGKKR